MHVQIRKDNNHWWYQCTPVNQERYVLFGSTYRVFMTKKCLKKSIWRSIDGLQLVIYCCQGYRMPRAINIHNHIITQWPTTCLDKDKGNLHEMLNSVKTLERAQIFTSTCSPMCICVSSLYLNEHEQIFIMVMERALPFLLLWILAPSRI